MEQYTKLSKFLSMVLRHHPETIQLKLDNKGWADVDELIQAMRRNGKRINPVILDQIVKTDQKQRYSYSPDKKKIRANQGHSIAVDVELKAAEPPEFLYHGTAQRFIDSIKRQGLKSMGRNYVHLSFDKNTAETVGRRHGNPVILTVAAGRMSRAGYVFYLSENQVWLTEHVPPEYLY